jgi:pyruvate formate lyase activating enzyme
MAFEMTSRHTPASHSSKLDTEKIRHPAWLYEVLPDRSVRCHLCATECRIPVGKRGVCHVRQNIDGMLYTLVYNRIISQHVDPIEKKPLYHFYPGSSAYSIATPGCNFHCPWCQNWDISQLTRDEVLFAGKKISAEEIVAAAQSRNCLSIAYTYTEPTVFFELAYDTARLAHASNLRNIYVTNGYMSNQMLSVFQKYLDAANVDLKAFRDETYRRHIGARLQPILDNMKRMKELGIWLEVTSLIIPGLNDDPSEMREMAAFISQELGPETPWHISRYFPAYQMADRPPTPIRTLKLAFEIGREAGINHVYMGNVHHGSYTTCANCGQVLIERFGYKVFVNRVKDSHCPYCGAVVVGVGMSGNDWRQPPP